MSLHPNASEPRDTVLGSLDYSGVELCTLAQMCLWVVKWSRMAEIINASGDPGALHATFGARIAGTTAQGFAALKGSDPEKYSNIRTCAKRVNFGKGGGMGSPKFVITCRKENAGETELPDGTTVPGLRFCVLLGGAPRCGRTKILTWNGRPIDRPVCEECTEIAEDLGKLWVQTFPEMTDYWDYCARCADRQGSIAIPQLGDLDLPPMIRGGLTFTQASNGHFQGLAALGAKDALCRIQKECYAVPTSPLFGSRVVFFVHDENVLAFLRERAHDAAYRACDIMITRMRVFLPDITGVKVEPALMNRWLKAAEPYHVDGVLTAWDESPKGREYLAKLAKKLEKLAC